MEVLYLTHPVFARHDTGSWHPERPARLGAAERGVFSAGFDVRRIEADVVDPALLASVHTPAYIEAIERFCASGGGPLDADTVAVEASWDAALRAAGAGPQAIELLLANPSATAFLAVRPPGHHALAAQAMGFCLFNNVVVTAAALTARGQKVAIIDWDVHHGNGTQALVWDDPDVLYVSAHQHPFYPMTGAVVESGGQGAEGTIINVPLPAGSAGDVYREIAGRIIEPALAAFDPDWILVSAGYDAHEHDPLADLRLESADYGHIAATIIRHVGPNRIISFLEGGYNLSAITESVAETLRGLDGSPAAAFGSHQSPPEAFAVVERVERSLR